MTLIKLNKFEPSITIHSVTQLKRVFHYLTLINILTLHIVTSKFCYLREQIFHQNNLFKLGFKLITDTLFH